MHPVGDLREAIERIAACSPAIRALGVRRLALFGSVLRGNPGAGSDADFLLEFLPGRKSWDSFLALAEILEANLGRRVELVTMEALSPYLGPKLISEAEDVLRAA